jgi:hypothetical protein
MITVNGFDPAAMQTYTGEARFFMEILPGDLPVLPGPGSDPSPPPTPAPFHPEELRVEIAVPQGDPAPRPGPYTVHVIIDPTINDTVPHSYRFTGVGAGRTVASVRALLRSVDATLRGPGGTVNRRAEAGTSRQTQTLGSGPQGGEFRLTTTGRGQGASYRTTLYFATR